MASFNPKSYKLLAFDIYGTLIDWETGIYNHLLPLYTQLPITHPLHPSHHTPLQNRKNTLTTYHRLELSTQKSQPTLAYPLVLATVYKTLSSELQLSPSSLEQDATSFGSSIGVWPAFPDSVAAMKTLSTHYKLCVLSNVSRSSFSQTLSGPLSGVHFDAIFTAEDVGSYKPDVRNFEYLIKESKERFGVEKEDVLVVAQSLIHDHEPARRVGLRPSVWISRGGEIDGEGPFMGGRFEEMKEKVELVGTYPTLGKLAEVVEGAEW